MIRATRVFKAGRWSDVATDTVALGWDDRHRRRLAMTGERGVRFLLDLPEAMALGDGDGLVLEDGRIVRVRAAPEALAELTVEDPAGLVRLAWHLGNRHLPTAILPGRLRIRCDHVVQAMAKGLGATVTAIEAPFDPEGGAYGHGHHEDGAERASPEDGG